MVKDQKQIVRKNVLYIIEEDQEMKPKIEGFGGKKQNKERSLSQCDDLSSSIRRTRKQLKTLIKMKKKLIQNKICSAPLPIKK